MLFWCLGFVPPGFLSLCVKGKTLHNYLAWQYVSQDFYSGAAGKSSGTAQLLISSVSSSFSQPEACRARGGGSWNAFTRKGVILLLLLFNTRLEELRPWPALEHTLPLIVPFTLCLWVCENTSVWAWVGETVDVWVTLQACKFVRVAHLPIREKGIMPTFIYA